MFQRPAQTSPPSRWDYTLPLGGLMDGPPWIQSITGGLADTVITYNEVFNWGSSPGDGTIVLLPPLNSRFTLVQPSAPIQGTMGFSLFYPDFGTSPDLSGLLDGDKLVFRFWTAAGWPTLFSGTSGFSWDPAWFSYMDSFGNQISGAPVGIGGGNLSGPPIWFYTLSFTWYAATTDGFGPGFVADMLTPFVIPSDRRLKKDVVLVGKSPSGISVYEFSYIDKPGRFRGAMAQDLIGTRHDRAVISLGSNLAVDYGMIDVNFVRLS